MSQHETKSCGRCNTPFECKAGNITECQCSSISLTPEESQFIAGKYADCLCRDCLLAIKMEFLNSGAGSLIRVLPINTADDKRHPGNGKEGDRFLRKKIGKGKTKDRTQE